MSRATEGQAQTSAAVHVADKERKRIAERYEQAVKDGTCEMGGHVNRQWAHLEGAVMVVQALKRAAQLADSTAPGAPELVKELREGLYAILGASNDKWIETECHKLIERINAAPTAQQPVTPSGAQ